MSKFAEAWYNTLNWEGGYSNDPDDQGNYYNGILMGTKYGITPSYLSTVSGITPTKEMMQNLDLNAAYNLALNGTWNRYAIGNITCQKVANQIFDMLFHFSYRTASILIQSAVISSGGSLPMYGIDEMYGSETLAAINYLCAHGKDNLLSGYLAGERVLYYEARVSSKPSQAKFLDGWIKRAISFATPIYEAGQKTLYTGANTVPAFVGISVLSYVAYLIFIRNK